jgi:hypothetical protein
MDNDNHLLEQTTALYACALGLAIAELGVPPNHSIACLARFSVEPYPSPNADPLLKINSGKRFLRNHVAVYDVFNLVRHLESVEACCFFILRSFVPLKNEAMI